MAHSRCLPPNCGSRLGESRRKRPAHGLTTKCGQHHGVARRTITASQQRVLGGTSWRSRAKLCPFFQSRFCRAWSARRRLPRSSIPVPAIDQSAVAKRGFFYVGGHYVSETGKQIMQGQVYVEVLVPKRQRRPYPLVLIHGAAQTATNWMGTPDGRKGWGGVFCRTRLCRLHGRSADARPLRLPPWRRCHTHVHRRERRISVHRDRVQWHMAGTRRSTRNGPAKGPTRVKAGYRVSTPSTRRRSKP